MGNSSTNSSSVAAGNISSNASLSGGVPAFHPGSFWSLAFSLVSLAEAVGRCHVQTGRSGWLGAKIFILLTALPANAVLLWTLLRGRKALTPSEVLGVNVSLMDVLYCLGLPLNIYMTLHGGSLAAHAVSEAFFSLNIFGCPLLLTCMCVERYVAAALPVTYLRLGRREYRAAVCACAWLLTAVVALCSYFLRLLAMALYLAATISVLFLVMLLCLLGIVRVLCSGGPAGSSGAGAPLKRRALRNVAAVMVPAVVAYSPLVALVPYMVLQVSKDRGGVSEGRCRVLQLLLAFPNVGQYIGPAFYLSRLTRAACWRKETPAANSRTQAE